MAGFWLKLWAFCKTVLFSAVGLYLLAFAWNNHGPPVTLWIWFGQAGEWQTSLLMAVVASFAAGAIFFALVHTTLKTWRQIRDVRARARVEKLQRMQADMDLKATRLRTHPAFLDETGVERVPDQTFNG